MQQNILIKKVNYLDSCDEADLIGLLDMYARDPMGRLIVAGTVAILFAHIFENIGMCVLIMPITGIPLPLVSYSGTFVVICMFLLGLVQSVWIHRHRKPQLQIEPANA